MRIVLDVSAAYCVVLGIGKSADFIQLLSEADLVISPDLFISEATNTAWKHFKIGGKKKDDCEEIAQNSIELIDNFISSSDIWYEALELSLQLNHPTYDCFYLVCARRNNAILLTADNKLKKIASDLGISIS